MRHETSFPEADNYSVVTTNKQDFLSLLNKREEETKRTRLPAKGIKFFSVGDTVRKNSKTLSSVPDAILNDTRNNTDIVARWGKGKSKGYVPMGTSAWISVKGRIDIYGNGFTQLKSGLQSTVLNKRFADIGDREVQVVTVAGKVRAIMSDEYAVIPASDFFTAVLQHVEQKYSTGKTIHASIDHNVSRLKIVFPEIADTLALAYNLPHKYTPGLIIETSDTGFCANRVCGFWQSGNASFITESNKVELIHIGGATIDKIIEQLPNIFIRYQNTVKKFAALMLQKIDSPLHVLKGACKELKLPRKASKAILEQFNLTYTGQPFTAYDIVREILAAPSLVELNQHQRIALEEKVEKAINLNFEKLQNE